MSVMEFEDTTSADIEAMTSTAIANVKLKLGRLPLIDLKVVHTFMWFESIPLDHLLSELVHLGFDRHSFRKMENIGVSGLHTPFYSASVVRSSAISMEALSDEVTICAAKAVAYKVAYDSVCVDTSAWDATD